MTRLRQIAFIVGALFALTYAAGLKTAVLVYEDTNCSAPTISATIASSLTCTPQINHFEPICEKGVTAYSVSDCINYKQKGWDDFGIIGDAFGNYPYLGIETYATGRCGLSDSIASSMIYRMDENCYPNAAGTESHKLTLGHSATVTVYSDATCTNVARTTTVRWATMGASRVNFCVDGMTTFRGGPQPSLTAVAVYGEGTCSGVPAQITFSQDFACKLPPNAGDSSCQSGDGSPFSVSECTSDYAVFAEATFGTDSPYILVANFPNPWCYDAEYATAYAADGICHTNTDGTTSFRATIDAADSSATILTYSDSACTSVVSDTNLDGTTLSTSLCMSQACEFWFGCGRKYSVGGLGAPLSMGKKTAIVVYEDSSCLVTPIEVVIVHSLGCVPPSRSVCDTLSVGPTAVYQARECIDEEDDFALAKFWYTPYLVVEHYANGTNCQALESSTMYVADGKCHLRISTGNYFMVTQRPDGAVVVATYPTSFCKESQESSTVVESWFVNTGACFEDRAYRTSKKPLAMKFTAIPSTEAPPSPAPQTWTPSPTTPHTWTPSPTTPSPMTPLPIPASPKDAIEARLEIMFPAWLWDPEPPRVFVSDGRRRHHGSADHQRFP